MIYKKKHTKKIYILQKSHVHENNLLYGMQSKGLIEFCLEKTQLIEKISPTSLIFLKIHCCDKHYFVQICLVMLR